MIKTLAAQIKEFKKASALTPVFMVLEVVFEMLIPLMMASINAKYHEKEAEIVSQAGRPGMVTIATNMAGRGTDIVLGGNAEFLARMELSKREDYTLEEEQALINAYKEKTIGHRRKGGGDGPLAIRVYVGGDVGQRRAVCRDRRH